MSGGNYQLLRLSTLLQLERRARQCSQAELGFLIVNDTHSVVPYQQAALWRREAGPGQGKVAALSGAVTFDPATPYAGWLTAVLAHLDHTTDGGDDMPRPISGDDLPPTLAAQWAEWLPPHGLWCPLDSGHGARPGGLLLCRTLPWHQGDVSLAQALAGSYAQAWMLAASGHNSLPWRTHLRQRRRAVALAAALLAALALFPVRQSVLAPAEIVPIAPMQIRAPFDGIVDSVAVVPNAQVTQGQILAALETTQLQTRLRVASKAREIAMAEFGQASQMALADPSVKGRLALLQGKIAQQEAELAYAEDQLRRAELTAPADGIAVFDDVSEWIGRPVAAGERIMTVADPLRVELEILVPVTDVSTFAAGAETVFFPNVTPDSPVTAQLTFASHASQPAPDGTFAHRFRAAFDAAPSALRLGMKGTAKIYGVRRPLLMWLLRRPLATVRQWLTL